MPDAYTNAYSVSDPNPKSDADPNADTCSHASSYCDTYANAYSFSDACAYAESNTKPDTHFKPVAHAIADSRVRLSRHQSGLRRRRLHDRGLLDLQERLHRAVQPRRVARFA